MKKFIVVITSFLLTILCINLCLKSIINKTINDSFTANVVGNRMDKITDAVDLKLSKYNTIQLSNDVRENSEMNIITKLFVDGIVNDLLNNTVSTIDINQNLQNIVDSTFKNYVIEKEKIQSVKDLIKRLDGTYFYNSLLYMVKNGINNNSLVNNLLHVYNFLTNNVLRYILIVLIIGMYSLVYFFKKNVLYTLHTVSKSLLIASGIMLALNMIFANYGMGILYAVLGKVVTMDFNKPILIDLLCFIFGLLIDFIIKKIEKNNDKVVNFDE